MAVLHTAIHPSHNTRGTETGCSYRTQPFMEDLDTSKTLPSSTLQCPPHSVAAPLAPCPFPSLRMLQDGSCQQAVLYCELVVTLLQDGEEEVRDEMATSVGKIFSHLSQLPST